MESETPVKFMVESDSQPATSFGFQQKSTQYDSVPRAKHPVLLDSEIFKI